MPVWVASVRDILAGLAAFGGVCTFIWAAYQWVLQRRDDRRRDRFVTFHKLVKELVQGDGPDDQEPQIYLHRQMAIVFELRRFQGYRPVTLRILEHLRDGVAARHPPLMAEIKCAIDHIRRPWWRRLLARRLDC